MRDQDRTAATTGNTPASRFLRGVDSAAAGPRAAIAVGVLVAAWLVAYALSGFREWMGVALQIVVAASTLVMVFVIQHTQRRSEIAMHLKLDALVRASEADDELAAIEHARGDQLEHHRRRQQDLPDDSPNDLHGDDLDNDLDDDLNDDRSSA